jgi:hypothetical protein
LHGYLVYYKKREKTGETGTNDLRSRICPIRDLLGELFWNISVNME